MPRTVSDLGSETERPRFGAAGRCGSKNVSRVGRAVEAADEVDLSTGCIGLASEVAFHTQRGEREVVRQALTWALTLDTPARCCLCAPVSLR